MTAERGGTSQSMSNSWLMWITVLSRCQEEFRPSHCSTSPSWITWFHVLSFSITLSDALSQNLWEIPLRWTADKWHASSCYLVEIPQHTSPWRTMCLLIYVLHPNIREWQENLWCMLSNHVPWPKTNTDVNQWTFKFSFTAHLFQKCSLKGLLINILKLYSWYWSTDESCA